MAISRQCKFYRDTGTFSMGGCRGYCDLDCAQATCNGDIDFCGVPISLRTYFFEQVKRDGGLEWKISRSNVYFSGIQKA